MAFPVKSKICNSIKVLLIILDKDQRIEYINKYTKEILNWKTKGIIGCKFNSIWEEFGFPNLINSVGHLILKNQFLSINNRILYWQSFKDSANGNKGIILIGQDMTKIHELHLQIQTLNQNIRNEKLKQHRICRKLENIFKEVTGKKFSKQLSPSKYGELTRDYLKNIIAKIPCYIYWKDLNFRYLGCNDMALSWLGLESIKDFIGKTDYDFGWDRSLVDTYREIDKEIISTGKPRFNIEEILVNNKGEKLSVLLNKIPLFDNKNEVIGIVGISIDIAKHKNEKNFPYSKNLEEVNATKVKEEELHRTMEKMVEEVTGQIIPERLPPDQYVAQIRDYLGSIIAKMPCYVYWKDKKFRYLGCNEITSKIMGLSSIEEVINKTDYDFGWDKDLVNGYRRIDTEIIKTGKPKLNLEETLIDKEGKEFHLLVNKMPLFGYKGEVIGIVGVSVDITERKNMEKALRKAKEAAEVGNKVKTEFIANMSHDIRTPIAGMLGMVQDLLNVAEEAKSSSNSPIPNIVEIVSRDAELLMGATYELLQLCNEILEVVRLESGKKAERLESFDLRELIQHNVELLQPVAHHKKIKLFSEVNESVPQYIEGMRIYLDRILLNLISNALKFTETGFVKVSLNFPNKGVSSHQIGDTVILEITIEDSGIGIPNDKFDMLFENFSRLTPSYEGLYKGAGLGLYTVKRYVDAMNGTIKVISEVGKGTSFIVSTPFIISDHAERPEVSVRLPKRRSGRDLQVEALSQTMETFSKNKGKVFSVLVVEDNTLAAMAVKITLDSFNCIIDVAENGEEAIKKAESSIYDFILMDVGLPDMDGTEATKMIRALEDKGKSSVPIIALTGHSDEGKRREECLNAGMQEVFGKPLQRLAVESILQRFVCTKKKWHQEEVNTCVSSQPLVEVIDWDACVQMCNGNPEVTYKLLHVLEDDLELTKKKLTRAYEENDVALLCTELHRVRGGISYLKVPQLAKALKVFHETVKNETSNCELLEKTYIDVQIAIENFKKVLAKYYRKYN